MNGDVGGIQLFIMPFVGAASVALDHLLSLTLPKRIQ